MNEKELQLKIAKKYGLPISPDKWDNYTKECMKKAYLKERELFNECGFQYKKKAKQNVSKLKVSDYAKKEFDIWMSDLIKKNGVTEL
jgi:hypothetical protein